MAFAVSRKGLFVRYFLTVLMNIRLITFLRTRHGTPIASRLGKSPDPQNSAFVRTARNNHPELDVSRHDWDSTHVFVCLGLAMLMSRLQLGPCKSWKMVMSQSRLEKILALKEFSGL